MDRKRLLFGCGLAAGTSYLSAVYDTTFALDRPLHTAAILLFLSGLAIVAFARLISQGRQSSKGRYESIPLQNGAHSSRHASPQGRQPGRSLSGKIRGGLAVLLLVGICVRLSIYYRVMKEVECSGPTLMEWVPLIVATFHVVRSFTTTPSQWSKAKPSLDGVLFIIFQAPSRYLIPAFLLSLSSCLAVVRNYTLRSTFICPRASGAAEAIPRLQVLGFFVDCFIAMVVYPLLEEGADENNSQRSNEVIGLTFVASSIVLFVAGVIGYSRLPEHREWFLAAPTEYVRSVLSISVVLPLTIVCFLMTARLHSLMGAVFTVAFSAAYIAIFRLLNIGVNYTFPPKPTNELLIYLFLLSTGLVMHLVPGSGIDAFPRARRLIRFTKINIAILAIIIFAFFGIFSYNSPSMGPTHPILAFIETAHLNHEKWAAQAARSKSLEEAVENYVVRYKRDPPPAFDKWYEFATSKNSLVIDDYDNIVEDLKPFWSLSPAEIRLRTTAILAEGDQGLGGISIRNGKVSAFADFPPTHGWMVSGAIKMIEKFAEHLPDMDLALNLNDEPRVAVPYDQMQDALWAETDHRHTNEESVTKFSLGRAATWMNISDVSVTKPLLTSSSFKRNFHEFGSVACPPGSKARSDRTWNLRNLCTSCASPHSVGALVADWSYASDPCHQPDFANLHGFYLSPSALVATHSLVPIFSQSRAPGYADIRYPSPWNYMDKSAYSFSEEYPDPAFASKIDTLFWRGATSEGVSTGNGAWKGMFRQRLVSLINNFDGPQAILVPGRNGEFRYVREEVGTIKHFLTAKLDVRFVEKIARCAGADCKAQEKEFKLSEKIDFREHWRYRYLFDADGAGFSGRFLPFLRSNSVVFKAGIFKEWYEGRLKAWKHFVPIDLRLHDLWSCLAFFGGYGAGEGRPNAGERGFEGNVQAAQRIARESRVWSEKVLRKDDMEVYFFRLLIEWGRLTDEKRDQLGYRGKKSAGDKKVDGDGDGEKEGELRVGLGTK